MNMIFNRKKLERLWPRILQRQISILSLKYPYDLYLISSSNHPTRWERLVIHHARHKASLELLSTFSSACSLTMSLIRIKWRIFCISTSKIRNKLQQHLLTLRASHFGVLQHQKKLYSIKFIISSNSHLARENSTFFKLNCDHKQIKFPLK